MFSGTFVAAHNNRERNAGSFLLLSFYLLLNGHATSDASFASCADCGALSLTDRIARDRNGEVSGA